mmetsp:Transcript_89978/g.268442  ORF Transcript_89978/g.268442 Transcript_89978/m.268442 type:complete len:288 (-) Transcript_89978:620-1483(-)
MHASEAFTPKLHRVLVLEQLLTDLLQHRAPMLTSSYGPSVDARHVCAGLAVVGVELRPHRQLQWLAEVLPDDGGIERLSPARALLDALGLLRRHTGNQLRSLMECRKPRVVPEVGEPAAEVETWGSLACTVAARAEAAAVDAAVARQRLALFQLLAGSVVEGLRLALLLQLHQCEPADHAAHLRLVEHLLRQLPQSRQVRGFGRHPARSGRTALHGHRRDALRAAALGPPLPHLVRLGELRLEGQGPAFGERPAAAAVPLLDRHALESDNGISLEGAVLLLGPLTPD